VVTEVVDDRPQEFPRVDERVVGRRHRFGYAAALTVKDEPGLDMGSSLVKHDLVKGTSEVRTFEGGAGEAVFVPAGDGAAEDDGYVLSLRYDAARDASDLMILHAQDFAGDPVATVHLPVRVPYGFHGNWVPDA
jgi:carotenoid cleavage dioxygenase